MYHSIKPGRIWLDTDGNRIQAHGGSIKRPNGHDGMPLGILSYIKSAAV